MEPVSIYWKWCTSDRPRIWPQSNHSKWASDEGRKYDKKVMQIAISGTDMVAAAALLFGTDMWA